MEQLRITIMMSVELDRKIRKLQAKQILETNQSCSYSQVVQKVLKIGLK